MVRCVDKPIIFKTNDIVMNEFEKQSKMFGNKRPRKPRLDFGYRAEMAR